MITVLHQVNNRVQFKTSIILNPVQNAFFVVQTADTYLKHPNSYLPKYNVNSETDGETTPLNANDTNRNSGESNAFESEEELNDQIEEEGWCWRCSVLSVDCSSKLDVSILFAEI